MKHLRCYADADELETVWFACDGCEEKRECDLCEPNSFEDLFDWMKTFEMKHRACAKPKKKTKPGVTVKTKPKTEPDPMAAAQASVLRERLGKLA
jgi:hypothetical protein